MNWARTVAKMVLYSLIGAMIFMLITWAAIWIQSTIILQDRLADLVYIVSEENCLSADGSQYSITGAGTYEKLLEQSETSWLKFRTVSGDDADDGVRASYSDGLAYFVGNGAGTREYLSYISAPQRGEPIVVKVRGNMELPVLIAPFGQQRLSVNVTLEKSYVTMGLKFYKDK